MIYATAKNGDGILAGVDTSFEQPDPEVIKLNAANLLGGTDWEYTELSEAQWLAWLAALPARSKLVGGVLTSVTPISASLSAGTVEADGVATITLSVNCHDGAYNGSISVKITPPSGEVVSATLTAIAGIGTESISTNQTGVHQITIETVLHGLAYASFEGV